jgi:hypothetical protein
MTRTRRIAALVAAALAATQVGYAWYPVASHEDTYVRWYVDEVPVFLDARLTPDAPAGDVRGAVAASIATWNAVDCLHPLLGAPVEVTGVGPTREVSGTTRGTNLIVFQDATEWADAHPLTPENILDLRKVLALTTLYYHPSTGVAESWSLEINDGEYTFSTTGFFATNDLQNMLTHELGHVLGLDHPCRDRFRCGEATMYFSAPAGETKKRDLDTDDIDGLCLLYGSEWVPEPPLDLAVSGGGCTAGRFAPDSGATALLSAFLSLALLLRRAGPRRRLPVGGER